jgi:drug/metabolite transporter (DMT)-like permease
MRKQFDSIAIEEHSSNLMQPREPASRLTAILQAVFVTFLWSTSWVLIKIGLRSNLPPITFAGLRYGLASLCLAPFVLFNRSHREILGKLSGANWLRLTLLGVIFYTIAQGAQYVSLAYLPAVMVNLLLNLTPIFVGFMALITLKEPPTPLQWVGILLVAVGMGVYFLPFILQTAAFIGLATAVLGVMANSIASLQGRQANRDMSLPPLLVTFVSMAIGAVLLLGTGLVMERFRQPTQLDWGIIAWLAVINTAFAFTLWNKTLRTLTAVESSILNSLMLPQIALMALFFLGEKLTGKEIVGLVLVGVGVIVVQLKQKI